jgi:hypothetical protein
MFLRLIQPVNVTLRPRDIRRLAANIADETHFPFFPDAVKEPVATGITV